MSKLLEAKAAEVEAKIQEAKKFYDDTDAQVAKGESLSEDQKKQIKDINKTIEGLEEEYKDLEVRENGREAAERRLKELKQPQRQGTNYRKSDDEDNPIVREIKTIADKFLDDPKFKAWREGVTVGDSGVMSGNMGKSPGVMFDSFIKTLLTGASATSAGALIENDRKPILDIFYQRPLNIRDLITVGETESDTVTFARVTSVTNNAAEVGEATATGDGTGNKPESAMALEEASEPVKTIAHWIPATRQALADAGQLRTLIDQFLRYGLDERLDTQMLQGSGTGQNLTGVYNTPGIQTQAFVTDILTSLRKARTKLRTVGRVAPTAWVMHPNDWETIDLLKDNDSRYIYGGPTVLGNPRVWGLPVVESEAATEGLPIGADWRMAVLWDRMQTTMYVSDSHSDFFIRNLLAILAELRAAFGVIRPKAFITVDVTP